MSDLTTQRTISRVDQLDGGRHASYLYELKNGARQTELRVIRKRRKTMGLYVENGAMTELRVPVNCAWRDIHDFLESRFEWVFKAEDEMSHRPRGVVDEFSAGGQVSFLGQRYRLKLASSRHNIVEQAGDELYVSCSNPGSTALVEKQVLAWYRRQGEKIFQERITALAATFPDHIKPGPLTIRKMKARWGSCSSKGDICLNLMLIREAPSQIDFVIAHELCHLSHFAHNKSFYKLLTDVMPDWREREAILGRAV